MFLTNIKFVAKKKKKRDKKRRGESKLSRNFNLHKRKSYFVHVGRGWIPIVVFVLRKIHFTCFLWAIKIKMKGKKEGEGGGERVRVRVRTQFLSFLFFSIRRVHKIIFSYSFFPFLLFIHLSFFLFRLKENLFSFVKSHGLLFFLVIEIIS